MVILDYVLGKQKEAAAKQQNQSPISAEEDAKIRNWVNQTYQWQSEWYKSAAYKDAYNAVLERKAQNTKKTENEVRRQINANAASYKWDDKVKKEQAKLAKAELAIYDAADIIKEWQRANWVKVNEDLTAKQTVDSFLLANNWQPYAEYVSKYINDAMNWKKADNIWLATKLWLDRGTTLWIDNRVITDLKDKTNAVSKWFAQWLTNLTQNTIGRFAEWAGSNIAAWAGEVWYEVAKELWADVSEWSVWDKIKKSKWYSWKEAWKEASSRELFNKWVLSENQWAFNLWETWWELAAEIALTAPAEWIVWWAITASKLGRWAKFWLQALNAAWAWAWFQLAEDLTDKEKVDNKELSSITDYAKSWVIAAWTAWIGNLIGKWLKYVDKKLPRKVFWPNERVENALLTKNLKEYDHMDSINSAYAKDPNVRVTPYTEMTKPASKAKKTIYDNRIAAWDELQNVRQNLKYIEWKEYTRENVKDDINKALRNLADKKKYWDAAKELDQIPQFEIKDWKLVLSENSKAELDLFKWTTEKDKDLSLWDEIIRLYDRVYGMWAKDTAANTHYFIQELKSLYKKWWSWGNPNILKETINSLDKIDKQFSKSLYAADRDALKKATTKAENAITLDETWDKLIWAMKGNDVEKVKEVAKWMKWWATIEQLFSDVKKATWWKVDMNNEVLSWAYNLSLHDVTKARDLLQAFYPSKAWMIETVIQYLSKPMRKTQARKVVESWKKLDDISTDTDRLNVVFTEIANIINSDKTDND